MKTNRTTIERLETLSEHLLSDALYNEPYTLTSDQIMIRKEDGVYQYMEQSFEYICRELPYVFPEDWIETNDGRILWILDEEESLISSLTGFFQISESAVKHFLIPGRQNLERFGGRILHNNSSHFEIALNIYELANKIERKSIVHNNPIFYN